MNFTFEQTCGLTRFNIQAEFENEKNEMYFVFSEKLLRIFAFTLKMERMRCILYFQKFFSAFTFVKDHVVSIGKMLFGFFYRQRINFTFGRKQRHCKNTTASIFCVQNSTLKYAMYAEKTQ